MRIVTKHEEKYDHVLLFTENRTGPSNLGSVFSQIILCKQLAPDFNQEELRSIRKDGEDMQRLIDDMQEFMPMEESYGKFNTHWNKPKSFMLPLQFYKQLE